MFQQIVIDRDAITQTQFTADSLDAGATYFWQVRAANLPDTSPWSSIFRLRMNGINLEDRLAAHYPFNGNPEDSVGNSDGTLHGDVTPALDRYSKPDHAYSFDGDGDYITLPESEAFTSIDREITVSAWIDPKTYDFETGLIHRDRFWRLFFYDDGRVVGNIFNENGSESRTGSEMKAPLNQWSHVAFTYDQQNINVYVNGKHSGALQYSISRIGEKGEPSTPLLGKGFGNSQNDFNGRIDEVRVYDRALSREEMAELYRRTATENFPPEIVTFSPAVDTVITEGDTLEFFVEIKDEDNDTLFCTWSYDDSTIASDTTTFKSSIIVPFPGGSAGKHSITASATDGKLTAENSWNVIVEEYISAVQLDDNNIPTMYSLEQNYPNPFNITTTIHYELPEASKVVLTIYDILGREIQTLVNNRQEPGRYAVNFDGSKIVSGIYFYKLQAGSDFMAIKKMLLLR